MKNLFFILVLFAKTLYSQNSEYIIQPPYNIKTFQVNNGKKPKSSNIIELGYTVFVSFDDLDADEKEYYYKVIRMDENWNPTKLQVSEYIDGFDSDVITDIEQSSGTLQSYTHYQTHFPNESTKILLSGNYILQILDDDENVIASKPFVLYKKKIEVGMQIVRSNQVQDRYQGQAVDFFLYKGNFTILNESQSLKIVLMQNNDWNSAIYLSTPTFYQGNKWIYHYLSKTTFDGLNEFRRFETIDLRGTNYNVVTKELKGDLYDYYLYRDGFRNKYFYYNDLNGAFVLQSQQADNVNTEADYVYVHFDFDGQFNPNERLYVLGKFNDFTPSDEYELKFNSDTNTYHTKLLLKQGYYNYMYAVQTSEGIDYSITEGNFFETENDYQILVYYRSPGSRKVEVIGYAEANSGGIR